MSKLPEQDPKKPMPEESQGEGEGMTLWEHLDELRSRLIKMILAFVVGGITAWTQKDRLIIIITQPFIQAWKEGGHDTGAKLTYLAPAARFIAEIRIAMIAGLIFALPIMLWQVWSFIAPGLYSKEKRYAAPFVVASCGLFAGGCYFGWKFAFPLAFKFLLGMGDKVGELTVEANITINDYLEFVSRMLIAFGVAAELPVLVFFLSVAGLITYKHMLKFFRYFLVLDFIIAAVITPPDMMSQLLLAIPLALLYGVSIIVAWIFGRKPGAEPPAEAA